MKSLLLISLALVLLLLTAGCLDDLSSTLPPCCDGTCNGVKTSVITVEQHNDFINDRYGGYVIDSDGMSYTWTMGMNSRYDPYNNHNVTFSYSMVNGHRHITGIIEDHDAKPAYCCLACCARNCSCPRERCEK